MDQDLEKSTPTPADPPFYNVMPQGGNMKVNTIKPVAPSPGGPSLAASLPSRTSKRGFYIAMIVIVIAVLGVGGFFGYRYFSKPPESNSVDASNQAQTEQEQVSQPSGVTTTNEWQLQYFGAEICNDVSVCGDIEDPDKDGLTNIEENTAKTDPQNNDSDGDKLADGDEVHVFGGDPLQQRTAQNPDYTDADDARGGYDSKTGKIFVDARLIEIKENISKYGLHEPSITTLGNFAGERYNFGIAPASTDTTLPAGVSATPQAMLDRDTQRLSSIKKIGAALLKYKASKDTFPNTTTFAEMVNLIKPYNLVATNYSDPINKGVYVYGYTMLTSGQNFSLSYYSETQKQVIKYGMADAQRDTIAESANFNDQKRATDLESIWMAMLLYSSAMTTVEGQYVFPTEAGYKTALVPNYIGSIPKDPKTGKDYTLTVSANKDAFTLTATLENPSAGATQIFCSEAEECHPK